MRKLYRSRTNKMIAGICGGLAETYSIDSTLVRLLTVLLCLVLGILPLVIVYIIAWIIVPVGSSPS
jgi:phage shock protein C